MISMSLKAIMCKVCYVTEKRSANLLEEAKQRRAARLPQLVSSLATPVFGDGTNSDTKGQERSSTFEDENGKENETSPKQSQTMEPVFGATVQGGTPEQSVSSTSNSLETTYDGTCANSVKNQVNQKQQQTVDGKEEDEEHTPQDKCAVNTTGDENGNQPDQQGGEVGKKATGKLHSNNKNQNDESEKVDGNGKGQTDIKCNSSHASASADSAKVYMKPGENYVEPSYKRKTQSQAQRYHIDL